MIDFKSIVLYNNYNNGDIHFSREFVKFFVKYANANNKPAFITHSKCCSGLLSDINAPYAAYDCSAIDGHTFHLAEDGTLFINTWMGQSSLKWCYYPRSLPGCTLDNNYRMFSSTLRDLGWGVSLSPIAEYIPEIDYSKYPIGNLESRIQKDKNIFIANGDCKSTQAVNFNFEPMINDLARKHPSCRFFVTEKINTDASNIIDANSLFDTTVDGVMRSNLNELSYLSSLCDIVVGRGSGPFCFAITKQNMLNPNKSFLGFGNKPQEIHWAVMATPIYNTPIHAKQIWHTTDGKCEPTIFAIIDSEITQKYGSN